MNFQRIAVIGVVGIVISACGGEDDMNMSGYASDLDRHVEAMRSELSTHAAEIGATEDVDGMMRAETAHRERNEDHMAKMDMVMGDMMSCTNGNGTRFDHRNMSEMMQDMRTECDAHRDAMRDLPDIEARRAEERRHQDAMNHGFDQMKGQTQSMMGMGGTFSCGHCTHCGM